MLPAVPVY